VTFACTDLAILDARFSGYDVFCTRHGFATCLANFPMCSEDDEDRQWSVQEIMSSSELTCGRRARCSLAQEDSTCIRTLIIMIFPFSFHALFCRTCVSRGQVSCFLSIASRELLRTCSGVPTTIAARRDSRSQAGFGPREARLNIWEDIIGLYNLEPAT